MDEKLKKLCGLINYNSYKTIEKVFTISTIGFPTFNMFMEYKSLYSNIGCLAIEGILVLTNFWLYVSSGESYTKDVKEINKLYNEFIVNYNKLNKTFELSNPIELYAIYNYLLYNGYLSVNKTFEFSQKMVQDINLVLGIDIINGHGVCRHISSMFVDILNNFGIDAYQLGVYSQDVNLNSINVNVLDCQKYTKDYLISWVKTYITDEKAYKQVMDVITELVDEKHLNIEIVPDIIKDKNPFLRIFGNHDITLAVKDGKSYYLDPTQEKIYRLNAKKDYTLSSPLNIDVPIMKGLALWLCNCSDPKYYSKIKEIIESKYPSVSLEEERELINKTKDKYTNNIDILEHFYNENKGLYEEISSRMLKLKK